MASRTLPKLLFFVLFCAFPMFGQTPFPFNESGFASVMKQAKAENKPVLYMFYASWCPHCHKMREEIFPEPEVAALLNRNFLVAAQDVELDGGRTIARKFNVTSYPTFVVLDPNGELLYGFNGELKKPDFIKEITDAADEEKQLPYLKKAFGNEPSDGNRALALIMALRKAGQPTSNVATRYFSTQKEEQLVSALNWKIIANGISDMGSREFQYVLKHQKEFADVSSEKRVQRKIENIVSEALRPNAEKGDTVSYNRQRVLAKAMNIRKADSLVYVYDKQIYEKVQDWDAYKKATIKATDVFASKDYSALRNTAAVYLAAINDKNALQKAVAWSERSTALQESKEGLLQTAKLYEKLNDIPKAVAAARRVKEFCERVGFGTKEADELLNRLQSK
ncbi:thioredoxin family protein [Flavobacterium sp. MAH-1]|uniref:Thioredoxin family protein n=1 Tax=Flavobacterium agri TaxID=2743471 RepID=A0A7Y8Y0Q7_9FLAO|nr:thioredoxin family protein [Flavobacterium agri]NUY79798.1 thioredoxin family protein [Flavobacterium agri]NYA69823.1 thioredoxin family protein [Flavobacterium agri]